MAYKDMPLNCQSCGQSFIFTAGEQEFYADKGFLHEPTRCPRCRAERAPLSGRSGNRSAQRDRDKGEQKSS